NFTIQKTFKDPSAKRNIKSFVCNPKPIIINGTEWLSLKVHGQSFMMHQIRKMVGMVALTVRCGCPIERIVEAQGDQKISIPKVPGLGLLLERPVFDSYNEIQAVKHDKEKLDFGKYEKELEEFKQREIYQRIFAEEERDNTFHLFFNQIDNYKERHFLYLTSKGLEAIKGAGKLDEQRAAKSKNDGADAMEMQ
ncbi:pseudouridine synthase, partial [Aureobasidium melanogenum]